MGYLGRISSDTLARSIDENLKKPGDSIIYQLEGDRDLSVFYYADDLAFARGSPDCPCDTIKRFKVRAEDFGNYFESDLGRLNDYVKMGLKRIVGWDFDKTLTIWHTWGHRDSVEDKTLIAANLRYPEDTRRVLSAMCQDRSMIPIIATKNYREPVTRCLRDWFGDFAEFPFRTVYGSEDFRGLDYGKGLFFQLTYHSHDERALVDGYLICNRPGARIDIVGCWLIDDDLDQLDQVGEYGIRGIRVGYYNNSHLVQAVSEFGLRVDVQERRLLPSKNLIHRLIYADKLPLIQRLYDQGMLGLDDQYDAEFEGSSIFADKLKHGFAPIETARFHNRPEIVGWLEKMMHDMEGDDCYERSMSPGLAERQSVLFSTTRTHDERRVPLSESGEFAREATPEATPESMPSSQESAGSQRFLGGQADEDEWNVDDPRPPKKSRGDPEDEDGLGSEGGFCLTPH